MDKIKLETPHLFPSGFIWNHPIVIPFSVGVTSEGDNHFLHSYEEISKAFSPICSRVLINANA